MLKKKFLIEACNGFPWTEGNLSGLGFEAVKFRTKSVLLVAPKAISIPVVQKLSALISLCGYKVRCRFANTADPDSRNVIVVNYGSVHSPAYIATDHGRAKLFAWYTKMVNSVLSLCRCDKNRVVYDDEKAFKRRFPTFLTPSEARRYLSALRSSDCHKMNTLLAHDDEVFYFANGNKSIIRHDEKNYYLKGGIVLPYDGCSETCYV